MSYIKNVLFDIQELLEAGAYPAEIVKRVPGATMQLVLEVEEDLYALANPRNFGPDYDQE